MSRQITSINRVCYLPLPSLPSSASIPISSHLSTYTSDQHSPQLSAPNMTPDADTNGATQEQSRLSVDKGLHHLEKGHGVEVSETAVEHRLEEMGYKQEMKRSLGMVAILGLSFAIMAVPFGE